MIYERHVPRPSFVEIDFIAHPHRLQAYDCCEIKQDGWYATLTVEDGIYEVWNRGGTKRLAEGYYEALAELGRIQLVGEYMWATNWVTRHPEATGQFRAFDVTYAAEDVSGWGLQYRQRLLSAAVFDLRDAGLPWVTMVKEFQSHMAPELWEVAVMGGDHEGLVFKKRGDRWGTQVWARQKRVFTQDYVVTKVCEGGGRLAGTMGSLICSLWKHTPDGYVLVPVLSVGGGFKDYERREWWNRQQLIAQISADELWLALPVIEVKGYDRFGGGSMRHPQFLRIRDDKEVIECRTQVPS